jgi:glycosyltransferase involved in cell wall biosynthesis
MSVQEVPMKDCVLISAFACDPSMGSEPYVGWNWLKQILTVSDGNVVLLTRRMHERPVHEALEPTSRARLDIVAFDLPGCAGMAHHHSLMKPYYVFWQVAALFVVLVYQLRHRSLAVIQQCTYNVVDMPGLLWLVPGTRFIWGPVGGGQIPPAWAKPLYGRGWIKQRWRTLMKRTLRFNPYICLASYCSSSILVANQDTLEMLPRFAHRKCIKTLETAVSGVTASPAAQEPKESFTLLWVGRLEPRKALKLLLDAIAQIKADQPQAYERLRIKVLGTGPDAQKTRVEVAALGLAGKVELLGALPFAEVQPLYEGADLFVFTSVQDTSGNVLLESLASGLPAIALNHQGPREILQNGGGRLIDAHSYNEAVREFARAILELMDAPQLLRAYAQAGLENIQKHCLWEQKGELFRTLLDAHGKSAKSHLASDQA